MVKKANTIFIFYNHYQYNFIFSFNNYQLIWSLINLVRILIHLFFCKNGVWSSTQKVFAEESIHVGENFHVILLFGIDISW